MKNHIYIDVSLVKHPHWEVHGDKSYGYIGYSVVAVGSDGTIYDEYTAGNSALDSQVYITGRPRDYRGSDRLVATSLKKLGKITGAETLAQLSTEFPNHIVRLSYGY